MRRQRANTESVSSYRRKQQALAFRPRIGYGWIMADHDQSLATLRQFILQARDMLTGVNLPEGRASRARELLDAAKALADDMVNQPPAAVLGSRGGKKTAERGPEYFKQIAAMRKTKAGGRPPKTVSE